MTTTPNHHRAAIQRRLPLVAAWAVVMHALECVQGEVDFRSAVWASALFALTHGGLLVAAFKMASKPAEQRHRIMAWLLLAILLIGLVWVAIRFVRGVGLQIPVLLHAFILAGISGVLYFPDTKPPPKVV